MLDNINENGLYMVINETRGEYVKILMLYILK